MYDDDIPGVSKYLLLKYNEFNVFLSNYLPASVIIICSALQPFVLPLTGLITENIHKDRQMNA